MRVNLGPLRRFGPILFKRIYWRTTWNTFG